MRPYNNMNKHHPTKIARYLVETNSNGADTAKTPEVTREQTTSPKSHRQTADAKDTHAATMPGNQSAQNSNTTNIASEKHEIHTTQNVDRKQGGATDGGEKERCTHEETANQSDTNRQTSDHTPNNRRGGRWANSVTFIESPRNMSLHK